MSRHALVLVHRGPQHVHRWRGSCLCGGWASVPLRMKASVVKRHQGHVARVEGRTPVPARRPLTPVDALPEALR